MMSVEFISSIFCVVVSVLFTAFFIPQILIVSYRKRLFDYADSRKVHLGVVPRLGGVAFVPSILITLALIVGVNTWIFGDGEFWIFTALQASFGICSLLLLYFEGIMDDLVGLRYRGKFVFQIVAAFLLVASGMWLNDFHGLFGVHELSPYFGIPLTVLLVVYLINAINLIDGIDGLASGLSIIASFFFGVMFLYVGLWGCAMLAFATFGTLCPFFYYNVFGKADKRRKIFMGDTGSQCIGLILAFLAIRLAMQDPQMSNRIDGTIIVAFSMLIIPMFDVVRVIIHRVRAGRNPFKPDKSHIHHKLLKLGLSHRVAMVSILLFAMFFVIIDLLLLPYVDVNVIFVLDIVVYTVFHIFLTKAIKNKQIKADAI